MRQLLLATTAALITLAGAATAQAQSCQDEPTLRSAAPGVPSELSFLNTTSEPRGIFWLDPEGRRTSYGIVDPGHGLQQATASDHVWVVTDPDGKCLMVVIASVEPRVIDLGAGSLSASGVVPPPPGVQTPLGSTAERAPASAVPTMSSVSPVDTFELYGLFRLIPRNDSGKALNNQENGRPEVVPVKPTWDSGRWRFEAVPGTAFVRVRNFWKGTYLQDDRGRLRASPAARDDEAAHWHFEPIDGSPYFQLINRETDRILVSRYGEAELTDAVERPNEGHWRLVPVEPETSKVVTVVPDLPRDSARERAYQDALDHCLERGGYWTGWSCKPYRGISRIPDCGRGWAWSEADGACVWDGGDARICPPWMSGSPPFCQADMTCRGGTLTISPRGYQNCDCPPGTSLWGDYPYFRCVRSYAGAGAIALPIAAAIIGLAAYQYVRRPGQPKTHAATSITKVQGLKFAPIVPPKGAPLPPATVKVTPPTKLPVVGTPVLGTPVLGTPVLGTPAKGTPPGTTPTLGGGTGPALGGGTGPATGGAGGPKLGPVACKDGQSIATGCTCAAPMTVIGGTTCSARVLAKPTAPDRCGPGTTGTPPNCVPIDPKKTATDAEKQAKDAAALKQRADEAAKKTAVDEAAAKKNAEALAKAKAEEARQKADQARRAAEEAAAKQKAAAEAERQRRAAEAENKRRAEEAANRARAAQEAARQRAAQEAARQKAAQEAARQRAEAEARRQAAAAAANAKKPSCPQGQIFKDGRCQRAP